MQRLHSGEDLAAATQRGRVAVLLHATWCPFCRVLAPVFAAACTALDLPAAEVLLDDEADPLWRQLSVEVVPTVLFYADGGLRARVDAKVGVGIAEPELTAALDAFAAR